MSVKAEAPSVKPNKRGVQSREVVLDAAEHLMSEQGYETASLNQVVEVSGIPVSSVYHYFGSKDRLFLAVMERGARRFFDSLPDIDVMIGTPEEHLTLVTQTSVDALEEHPDFLRLVVVMAAQPPVGSIKEAAEVVARVRNEALARLRKHAGIVFEIDENGELADKLARFGLANFDGAFIAQQSNEDMALKDLPTILPAALIGLHKALSSKTT